MRDAFDDLASRELGGADKELLALAVKLGLASVDPKRPTFAPCMLLWPSKIVISTTGKAILESWPVADCVAYLREALSATPDVTGYAIVTDARQAASPSTSGTPPNASANARQTERIDIELGSTSGGFRVTQAHDNGAAEGEPDVYDLFASPLLTLPTAAELELVGQAFIVAEDFQTVGELPIALLADEEPPTLLHLEQPDGPVDAAAALYALAEHVYESYDPCLYSLAYAAGPDGHARTRVEVGNDARAFVFEQREGAGGDDVTLKLVARSASLWKKLASLRKSARP